MSDRAIDRPEAMRLCRTIERAWNTRKPSAVIRLLRSDAVWRDNGHVCVGRDEIWTRLRDKWEHALHYRVRQTLRSYGACCIGVSFESEWQDSVHGNWHRTSGQCEINFDGERRITTLESAEVDTAISTTERRLRIKPAGAKK